MCSYTVLHVPAQGPLGDAWARAGGESPGRCHCSGERHLRALKVLMGLKCIFQIFSELITPPPPRRGSTPTHGHITHMGQWRGHPRVAKRPRCLARPEVCCPPTQGAGGT